MVRGKCSLWLCGLLLAVVMPAQGAEDLYIEAVLSAHDPYIQAPVEYRIRLYRALTLSQGSLILPEQGQLVVELLGESVTEHVEREGRLYQMQEQRYLLFPQRSGRLVVEAPVFSGRQLFARGPELELEVRPRPASIDGPWIPAHDLALSEAWHTPDAPWRVGDLLEREITIEARGLTGAQLPVLATPRLPGMEVQELAAEVGQRIVAGQMIGWRIQRQRFLALDGGRFELPMLRLSWWALAQDEAREARLPGRTLEFMALGPAAPMVDGPAEAAAEAVAEAPPAIWPVALLSCLLLLLAVLGYRYALSPEVRQRRKGQRLLRQVEAACRNNDAPLAAKGLLEWMGSCSGDRAWTLGRMAQQLDDEAARALWALDAQLYQVSKGEWDGAGFAAKVLPMLRGRQPAHTQRSTTVLPPLNP